MNRLSEDLIDWIAGLAGPVESAQLMPGGNRKQAWAVEAGGQSLFLRVETARDPNDPYDLSREAAWYRALQGQGVAIPLILGFNASHAAMLMRRVVGSSSYRSIPDRGERQKIALDLMDRLAALHGVAATSLDMPSDLLPPTTIRQAILDEIEIWERQYRATARTDPLIEFAVRWLRDACPADPRPPGVVHGDAGPGNFLHQNGQVTAMVDWELTHFGDPVEDLAWLSMRTVLEPFPDFPACLDHYAKAVGKAPDLERLRYYRVLVQLRVAVIRWIGEGQVPANSLLSSALNRRLLTVALAEATGINLPPPPDPAPASDDDGLAKAALDELRHDVVPHLSDAHALQHAKSLARMIKRLRDGPRYAADRAAEERKTLRRLLGDAHATPEEFAARLRSGEIPAAEVLPHLSRMAGYETRMAEDAMGALAWRGFPPLERKMD